LKISASRNPNYSPPSPSSFAAETTTLYPVFYKFITTSTPKRQTEFTGAPAWPYSGNAIINQTPGNYPKESLVHSVHGESLKSRMLHNLSFFLFKMPFNS